MGASGPLGATVAGKGSVAPEAVGLDAIVRGMGRHMDDDALLKATEPIYDGLLTQLRILG